MVEVAVVVMVLSMLITLIYVWNRTGSFRTGFTVMLITGKIWAGILFVFKLDKPLFNIIVYDKVRNTSHVFTVTACQLVFLSFLSTLLVSLFYPYLEPYLPECFRRLRFRFGG